MPSKIQLDENLWFLYICLQKSDLKTIDFNAVGNATSLKPPAARMRYTRLRRQIESGTLIGAHGTPFASSSTSDKIAERASKRKRSSGKDKKEKITESKEKEDDGDKDADGEVDDEVVEKPVDVELKAELKKEEGGDSFACDNNSTEAYSDDTDSWSSEDEIPLAKLRKSKKRIATQTAVPHEDPTIRAAREGAPIRELEQKIRHMPQPQSHLQLQHQPYIMSQVAEQNAIQHYNHQPAMMQEGRNVFPPAQLMQMYAPMPHYQMQMPLPPFGESFGPYHNGWNQFEDTRVSWSDGMEHPQNYPTWRPRKSV